MALEDLPENGGRGWYPDGTGYVLNLSGGYYLHRNGKDRTTCVQAAKVWRRKPKTGRPTKVAVARLARNRRHIFALHTIESPQLTGD